MRRRNIPSELQEIGVVMRAERKRQKLSQRVLAERMGVQQSTISEYESGYKDMTISSLLRWLETLGFALEVVIAVETEASE